APGSDLERRTPQVFSRGACPARYLSAHQDLASFLDDTWYAASPSSNDIYRNPRSRPGIVVETSTRFAFPDCRGMRNAQRTHVPRTTRQHRGHRRSPCWRTFVRNPQPPNATKFQAPGSKGRLQKSEIRNPKSQITFPLQIPCGFVIMEELTFIKMG